MLTILAVIGCAATLQTAGGLNVMMQFAERLLRKHPQHITLLAPFTTDVDLPVRDRPRRLHHVSHYCGYRPEKGIRPERPMAVASVASQMAITASPFPWPSFRWSRFWVRSTVSATRGDPRNSCGLRTGLTVWRRHCGTVELASRENLADDPEFQEKLKDPKQREFIYGGTETLMDQRFPKQAYWSTWIFFAGIAVVVLLGALPSCVRRLRSKAK